MKKEYAVNIKKANCDGNWKTADMADWYQSFGEAIDNAEKKFNDPEVQEVMIAVWEDGEIEDFPLYLVREDGVIRQYKNGERLWL